MKNRQVGTSLTLLTNIREVAKEEPADWAISGTQVEIA
jgi:hypothetical protein